MKKVIEIEFPDGFCPPKKFDDFGNRCEGCPFKHYDDLCEWCSIADRDDVCPIRKFFKED